MKGVRHKPFYLFYCLLYFFNLSKVDLFIYRAPIVYIGDSFYVFGGHTDASREHTVIAKLNASLVWSKAGELKTGRAGHNVIFDGSYALIVGGYISTINVPTERCSLTSEGFTCTSQRPVLQNYSDYPELFTIPHDYCKSLS